MIVFSNEEPISVTLDTGDPNRPAVFHFRPMTFGEIRRVGKLKAEIDAAQDADGKLDVIASTLTRPLIGWSILDVEGNPVPFEPKTLMDFLPQPRVAELIRKLIEAQQPSAGERGK